MGCWQTLAIKNKAAGNNSCTNLYVTQTCISLHLLLTLNLCHDAGPLWPLTSVAVCQLVICPFILAPGCLNVFTPSSEILDWQVSSSGEVQLSLSLAFFCWGVCCPCSFPVFVIPPTPPCTEKRTQDLVLTRQAQCHWTIFPADCCCCFFLILGMELRTLVRDWW